MKISPRKWLVPILIVALALSARLMPGPRTIDDSFITFRYARNLLAGEGFVYNPGERVLGTTTPLYTLLMAALALPFGGEQAPFPWLALGVNALADATACLLLWQIGKKLNSELAGIATALVWAVAPYSVTFAVGGLETSLYVCLLTAAVWAYLARRRLLTPLFASLALLTRPDALILVMPLVLDRLYRGLKRSISKNPRVQKGGETADIPAPKGSAKLATRPTIDEDKLSWREVAVFVLPLIAWYGFAWLYFGSPLPHSVTAKLLVYRLGAGSSFIRLLQHYATPFMEAEWGGVAMIGIGLVLYPFLFIIGARRALKTEARALAWVIYPVLYFIAFALPNPLLFRWYLTPPLPAWMFFILMGLEGILGAVFTGNRQKNNEKTKAEMADIPAPKGSAKIATRPTRINMKWVVEAMVIALPLASSLAAWRITLDHGPARPAPEMAFIKLEMLYHQVAEKLKSQITPGTLLAAGDVGVLGYETGARILDTVGLNSPTSLEYYPLDPAAYVINYAIPAQLILDQQPDWVVILEVYGRNTLLENERFLAEYELVETLPTDLYGSRGMLVFKRNP